MLVGQLGGLRSLRLRLRLGRWSRLGVHGHSGSGGRVVDILLRPGLGSVEVGGVNGGWLGHEKEKRLSVG